MKRAAARLALAVGLLAVSPLRAGEPPHLEFVRGLRERNYADLALEYLLKQMPKAPPDQAPAYQLELAKTRLELAGSEPDLSKRLAKYGQARQEFDKFLQQYGNHALAGEAGLDRARVAVLQGKSQLSFAVRQGSGKSDMARAKALLEDAGKQLSGAAQQLENQAKKLPEEPQSAEDKEAKAAVERARVQAQLDVALNLFDQAQTYLDQADSDEQLKRAEVVKKARNLLEGVISKAGDKSPIKWQAQAWLGRSEYEAGDPKSARRSLTRVLDEKAPEAAAGKRLAGYFLLLVLPYARTDARENTDQVIRTNAEDWLKANAPYANTPEGYGVRFELAQVYQRQAIETKQVDAQTGLFARAVDLYKQLERAENDFVERARQQRIQIIFTRQQANRLQTDISRLLTFDDCYVRAQYEFFQMAEEAKKKDPDLEKKREAHYANIITALRRGLELAKNQQAKVIEQDVNEARFQLAYAYLNQGKNTEARAAAEELARVRPPNDYSPRAAAYALQAYEGLEDERDQHRQFAEYVEQTWPDDPVANKARHHLGRLLIGDRKFAEAVEKYQRVKPEYPLYTLSQFQLAAAALEAKENNQKPVGADQRSFEEQAISALESIPEAARDADPGVIQAFLKTRLLLAQTYYRLKKFDQMERVLNPLRDEARLAGYKERLEPNAAAEIESALGTLALLATYADAEKKYMAGQYEEVCKQIDPVVGQIRDGKLPEVKKNPQLYSAILGLGLRANVQANKTDKAKEILDELQKASKEGDLGDATQLLLGLVQTLREQVQELRKKGPSAKEQLDKTVASFAAFLDELGKQPNQPTGTILFLAQSYSSLGLHGQAAELLAKVPAPRPEPGKEPDQAQVQSYHGIRLLQARELRLDKKFAQAEKELKEIGDTWGKGSVDVTKEKNLLLEDQEKYVPAAQAWNALMSSLRPKLGDLRAREQYWEAYYHLTYCVYKNALKQSDGAKRLKGLRDAANYIIRLESSQPDMGGDASKKRFEELLQGEAPLKQQYDELKKGAR